MTAAAQRGVLEFVPAAAHLSGSRRNAQFVMIGRAIFVSILTLLITGLLEKTLRATLTFAVVPAHHCVLWRSLIVYH